jgi:MATE family multidrug resistance protein
MFHFFDSWLFIAHLHLGIYGAAYSSIITCALNTVLSTAYIFWIKPLPEAAQAPTWKSFEGIGRYIWFTLPLIIIYCAGTWGLEILNIIALNMSPFSYSAYTIVFNCCVFAVIINSGLITATSILLARNLGAGKVNTTKYLITICITFGLIISTLVVIIYVPLRSYILHMFTNIDVIYDRAYTLSLYFILLGYPFLTSMTLAGVFRGIGKQVYGSLIEVINMYIITCGSAAIFVYYCHTGPVGIYAGICMGSVFSIIMYLVQLYSYDFNVLKVEAISRVIKELHSGHSDDIDEFCEEEKPLYDKKNENSTVITGKSTNI